MTLLPDIHGESVVTGTTCDSLWRDHLQKSLPLVFAILEGECFEEAATLHRYWIAKCDLSLPDHQALPRRVHYFVFHPNRQPFSHIALFRNMEDLTASDSFPRHLGLAGAEELWLGSMLFVEQALRGMRRVREADAWKEHIEKRMEKAPLWFLVRWERLDLFFQRTYRYKFKCQNDILLAFAFDYLLQDRKEQSLLVLDRLPQDAAVLELKNTDFDDLRLHLCRLPFSADAYYQWSGYFIQQNEMEKAEAAIKKAIELDPENGLYPVRWAEIAPAKAISILREASYLANHQGLIRRKLGERFVEANPDDARVCFKSSLQFEEHADAYAYLGKLSSGKKQKQFYEKALALDPRCQLAAKELALLEADENPERAIQLFNRCSLNPEIRCRLGELHYRQGNALKALEHFSHLPDESVERLIGEAKVFLDLLKDEERARASIEKAYLHAPYDHAVAALLGEINRDPDKLKLALKSSPNNRRAWLQLAKLTADENEKARCLEKASALLLKSNPCSIQ